MTKYSTEFKIEVVQAYLSGKYSYASLADRYQIPNPNQIYTWVRRARSQGLETLQKKKHHRSYTLEKKLAVVDYYQTHDEGVSQVAIKFDINPSQVTVWSRIFNESGAAGLRPRPKGRRPTMIKKKSKKTEELTPTEKEQLVQENMHLRKELYKTKMERDILKELGAISKNKRQERKPK
jgi:transposase